MRAEPGPSALILAGLGLALVGLVWHFWIAGGDV